MSHYYIGIDWADDHHDIHITDDSAEKIDAFRIQHSLAGMKTILEHVYRLTRNKKNLLFALETDKGLLVNFLLDNGFTVFAINPKAVDRFRDRYDPARNKTDQIDAMLLADILRTDRHRFRTILPESDKLRELRILTRDHKALITSRTRLTNQLIACLKSYYPLALELFCDVKQQISLDFLSAFPDYVNAQKLTLNQLKIFLKEHSYPCPQRIKPLFERLKTPQIPVEPFIIRAKSKRMLPLAANIKAINAHINEHEKEIAAIFKSHPDSKIFLSLPGADITLAARILSELGDNRDRYKNYNDAQCEAGTAPVTKQSGNYRHVIFRKACKKPFRDAMQLFTFCSTQQCQWAHTYYLSQKQRGKRHPQAIRALANKWLKIIYIMWKNQQPYNEQFHLNMLKNHLIKQL
ncbi:IS110 family transposase [bacterium]|nr:IS110 family transposase [bacterium]